MKSAVAFALLLLSGFAHAQWTEMPIPPQRPPSLCPVGQAFTFTMQCDHGTRTEIDRFHGWGAGVEICKVSQPRCLPVIGAAADARPGFEVQDSLWGELATVVFGLDDLLGVQRSPRGRR